MLPVQSVLTAIFEMGRMVAEEQAELAAAPGKSREWNRAVRASRAQEADALRRGAQQAGQLRMRGTQVQGQQTLAQAVGNIEGTSGTAAQLERSTGLWAELDAETSMNNARREALGHQQVQQQLYEGAQQEQVARRTRGVNSWLRAGGSILNAAARDVRDAR